MRLFRLLALLQILEERDTSFVSRLDIGGFNGAEYVVSS